MPRSAEQRLDALARYTFGLAQMPLHYMSLERSVCNHARFVGKLQSYGTSIAKSSLLAATTSVLPPAAAKEGFCQVLRHASADVPC